MDLIYLDNNATTPMLPAVAEAMRPYWTERFGNPASAHQAGRRARQALEDAREQIASLLDALPEEVIFTSGATEGNNLAIFGLAGQATNDIAVSPMEHPSVKGPVERLKQIGHPIHWLDVNETGIVLSDRLGSDFHLLCVQLANHETGTIQPIAERTKLVQDRAYFHCDATQAVGRMPVRFHELGVTTLSFSAHKFHGPKGIGVLLVKRGTKLAPLLHGGHQQHSIRPGTEPVALVVGLTAALKLACKEMDELRAKIVALRRHFLEILEREVAPVVINGPLKDGMPHTLNLSFPGCQADLLLINLDLTGVACSTGSACSSGSLLPSPVLQAMKVGPARLQSAMRFSLSHLLTEAEVAEAARRTITVVRLLRKN